MPTLNLTKVAFACRDLDTLQQRIAARTLAGEVRVPTRMRPKRAPELIGGNLFWIVKHRIVAGLEILRFEDREDGRIDIVCSAQLQVVPPIPRRAHQGWRYFELHETAVQEEEQSGVGELLPNLYGRLASLALV